MTTQNLPLYNLRSRPKELEIVEKHLIVTTNADCVPPMLKTETI